MEFEERLPLPFGFRSGSVSQVKCCDCGCSCYLRADDASESWFRSVKRKYEFESSSTVFNPGFDLEFNPRVHIENECAVLREAVASQQLAIQELYAELEQERNAASSAANEAMSMILKLQREKAELQMEARQYKRFVEEKMAHDLQEVEALEDLLYKREQAIQSLTWEVQAYKHQTPSFELPDAEIISDENFSDYPPLLCSLNDHPLEDDTYIGIETYPFGESPRSSESLKDILKEKTFRSSPSDGEGNAEEKTMVGQSPKVRGTDSTHIDTKLPYPMKEEKSDCGDDVSDRECTPSDPDLQKLYTRLQALEDERESMKQAILSMRANNAQLVLLKEIAQQLREGRPREKPIPAAKRAWIWDVAKWIASLLLWWKRAQARKDAKFLPCSSRGEGLLMLLDKSSLPRSGDVLQVHKFENP